MKKSCAESLCLPPSIPLNQKLMGHCCGSATFPWQLGQVSTEASGGSWLNHADGNQAAPGCGLMLSPHLSKLSCLTLLLGKLKVFKGQLALPNNSTECKEHTFFPPPSDSRHSNCRIAQMIFLNLGCFIWLLILIQRASHNAVLLKTVLILVFFIDFQVRKVSSM